MAKELKKINLNVPASVYRDLQQIAESTGRSMSEIIRSGISLAGYAYRALENGQTLQIAGPDGKPVKEILIVR